MFPKRKLAITSSVKKRSYKWLSFNMPYIGTYVTLWPYYHHDHHQRAKIIPTIHGQYFKPTSQKQKTIKKNNKKTIKQSIKQRNKQTNNTTLWLQGKHKHSISNKWEIENWVTEVYYAICEFHLPSVSSNKRPRSNKCSPPITFLKNSKEMITKSRFFIVTFKSFQTAATPASIQENSFFGH